MSDKPKNAYKCHSLLWSTEIAWREQRFGPFLDCSLSNMSDSNAIKWKYSNLGSSDKTQGSGGKTISFLLKVEN